MPGPLTRPRHLLVAGITALALTACGSQLSPSEVAGRSAATGIGAGTGTGTSNAGDPGTGTDSGLAGDTGSSGSQTNAGSTSGTTDTGTGSSGATDNGTGSSTGGQSQVKSGSCDGFTNGPGITDDTITLANVADINGPVPGLFQSAQDGTRAYINYFNQTHPDGICGRTLKLELLDSRSDGGADQQAYAKACADTFAAVGSASGFDSGGAATAQKCGIPDLRAGTFSTERLACSTCFATQPVNPAALPSSVPKFFYSTFREATQNAAFLYIDVAAAKTQSLAFIKSYEKNGWKVNYVQGVPVSEFNYSAYVRTMVDKGIKLVEYAGPYQNLIRLQQTMDQQDFHPIVVEDALPYDPSYVQAAGDAGNGMYAFIKTAMIEQAASNPELATYISYLRQVNPSAKPATDGMFAWAAAKLFTELALKLGGKLTRSTLLQAIRKTSGWTGGGIIAPAAVGTKQTANCVRIIQLNNGAWKQISPGTYQCGPLTPTGLG